MFDGFATIMTETGCYRPFEELNMSMKSGLYFGCFSFVHTWNVDMSGHLDELLYLTPDVMPQLKRLIVIITYQSVARQLENEPLTLGIMPLLDFASIRPIELFDIRLCDTNRSSGRVFIGMSRHEVQTLFQIKSLKSLSLDDSGISLESYLMCDLADCLDCLMLPNLPSLTKLELAGSVLAFADVAALLKVTPLLTTLIVADSNSSWTSSLPLIAKLCPWIQSVWFQFDLQPRTRTELQSSIDQCPLDSTSFQHLISVRLVNEALPDDALHFMLSQLSIAPRLSQFSCGYRHTLPSLFRIYLQSKLPHLAMIGYLERQLLGDLPNSISDPPIFQDIRSSARDSQSYRTFRTLSDDPPGDGRTAFFQLLASKVSAYDLARLYKWDSGNYS